MIEVLGTNSLSTKDPLLTGDDVLFFAAHILPAEVVALALGMTRSWVSHSGSLHARSSETAAVLCLASPFPAVPSLTSVY